jgi:hypothetical protein
VSWQRLPPTPDGYPLATKLVVATLASDRERRGHRRAPRRRHGRVEARHGRGREWWGLNLLLLETE